MSRIWCEEAQDEEVVEELFMNIFPILKAQDLKEGP